MNITNLIATKNFLIAVSTVNFCPACGGAVERADDVINAKHPNDPDAEIRSYMYCTTCFEEFDASEILKDAGDFDDIPF